MLPLPRVLRAVTRVSPALSAHGPGRPPAPATVTVTVPARHRTHSSAAVQRADAQPDPPRQKMPSGGGRGNASAGDGDHLLSGPGPSSFQPKPPPRRAEPLPHPGPQPPLHPHPSSQPPTTGNPRPSSIVHTALDTRHPPSPRDILSVFDEKPHLLTPADIPALDAYATRTHDKRVRRRLRSLLKAQRMAYTPLQSDTPPTDTKSWSLRDKSEQASWQPGKYSFARWRPYPGSTTSPIPNKMLYKQLPPLPNLPDDPSPSHFTRHQHHLHLMLEPFPLPVALATASALGGPALPILHLALAYTTSDPHDILNDESVRKLGEATRQTLHAAMLALLRRHYPLPSYIQRPSTELRSTTTAQAPPTPPPATLADIHALEHHPLFTRNGRRIRAGPETWRHVALHAAEQGDEQLARYAFEHARLVLRYEYRRAAEERRVGLTAGRGRGWSRGVSASRDKSNSVGGRTPTSSGSSNVAADPRSTTESPLGPFAGPALGRVYARPDGALSRSRGEASPASAAQAVPAARFAHLGRNATRWERTMGVLAERGWAVREGREGAEEVGVEVEGGEREKGERGILIDRWRWREPAEEGAEAVPESEGEAVAEGEDKSI